MNTEKEKIITDISKEIVQVMLRNENKSEILSLYNQSNETMENCARRWLEDKMRKLN